ncbi:MAG: HAMP domain-containing sensor histidine kinase [Bdellovibrionota bacterium]
MDSEKIQSNEKGHKAPERCEDSILILDLDQDTADKIYAVITEQMPEVKVDIAINVNQYLELLTENKYEIVVLSDRYRQELKKDIIHELRLLNHAPSVLLISNELNSKNSHQLVNSGADKCLLKKDSWLDELGPSVRHLLRFRKLEEENQNLLAKLTEANIMLGEKNKRLDEFSATVAHDIRGPLAGISMKLEYLIDTYDKEIDDKFSTLLTRALETSQRLTDMVQSMYGFARLGKEAAKMKDVDLNELVRQVIEDIHFDPALDIQIGIDELPSVWGSPQLLRRVFSNLISNAVKYNDKNTIIINVGLNDIREKSMAKFCEVFVEDNGPGIDKDELRDIFSMFNRGAAVDPNVEGTGIGLAVVQRIVELHYGDVSVKSEEGEGTKFLMSLPMQPIDFIK